ncbi:methyltransferase [Anabaena sp. CCY 0017]|uniref:methyltransferase n=1 Tax=Anabaena sp. CCY 0017 TaxID=3103866 RepID=UPI0039C687E3
MGFQQDTYQSTSQIPLAEQLKQMICGFWLTQSIYVAAKLGIADLLKDGAKSAEELAKSTEVDAESLYRLMRALCSIAIFTELENRRFQLTPMAEYLRSDVPDSLQAMAIMFGSEDWHWQPWGNILYSIKTGKPAFDDVFGTSLFPYLAQKPEAAAIFDTCMTSFSSTYINPVVSSYDFSSINTLIDVGGGHGTLLASILKNYPKVKGIVYDQEQVIEGAKQHLEASELEGRWQLLSGDFFESVPSGGDAYIMKHIIHDWDDESAIKILQNCHHVMPDNGKVLVVENVIPNPNEPSLSKFLDLEMLIMTSGGRERTATEFEELFAAAGFKLTKIIPTPSSISIIEGVKISAK